MDLILLTAGWIVGGLIYKWTPKERRTALVTLVVGAVCGGVLAEITLPMIGVRFFSPWALLGGWLFCSLVLHVTMRHMNKGAEMNLLALFGFGLFSPILASLAVLALVTGTMIFGKAKI